MSLKLKLRAKYSLIFLCKQIWVRQIKLINKMIQDFFIQQHATWLYYIKCKKFENQLLFFIIRSKFCFQHSVQKTQKIISSLFALRIKTEQRRKGDLCSITFHLYTWFFNHKSKIKQTENTFIKVELNCASIQLQYASYDKKKSLDKNNIMTL